MLFAQRRSSSPLSLGLHRPVRIESPRPARASDRVQAANPAARSRSVHVVLTSRGVRAVPPQSVACDVPLRRPPVRLGATTSPTSSAAAVAVADPTTSTANGSHHAIELVGACMMIAVFLVLALFA